MPEKRRPDVEPPDAAEDREGTVALALGSSSEAGEDGTAERPEGASPQLQAARGTPAPLRQEDVDGLMRGETTAQVAALLASRPLETIARERRAEAKYGPVKLDGPDLRRLFEDGTVTERFEMAVERGASIAESADRLPAAKPKGKAAPDKQPDD